ncbi:MAG: hypothetical protein D6753_03310 [Planctomycetota bacterium]|nr:MAG: hypothetical protein D6753_03310 [Planctomycetota bacterium]
MICPDVARCLRWGAGGMQACVRIRLIEFESKLRREQRVRNMDEHWVFDDVAEADREMARQRWAEKVKPLQKLLRSYEPDKLSWRMTLYHIPRGSQWQLRAVLLLPTGTLVAETTERTLEEAIDRVADKMRREIRKHKELVRQDYIIRRRREQRQHLSAAGSYLQEDVEKRRREAFFALLRPHLRDLKKEVAQRLRFLRNEGLLHETGLTPEDVVDDVLLRAWSEYAERPTKIDLQLWLTRLAQQRLEQACQEPAAAPLTDAVQEPPAAPDEPLTPDEDMDEPEYWLERFESSYFANYLEDLIPDPDSESAQWWASLSDEERQERFEKALGELPADQRDALWLQIVAGYEAHDIAVILDRDPGEIESLIQQGRKALSEKLLRGATVAP